mmetsp:Transcript_53964/g.117780  ORF Transcript_53964/g.117780 Transcript_53964/m.117780 type:complete len:102 (+) Transcript_53964:93-398(+)
MRLRVCGAGHAQKAGRGHSLWRPRGAPRKGWPTNLSMPHRPNVRLPNQRLPADLDLAVGSDLDEEFGLPHGSELGVFFFAAAAEEDLFAGPFFCAVFTSIR